MFKMKIIYLLPKSSLIGTDIHSDTLFGALCWGIRHVYRDDILEDLLSKFASREPPFFISSAFPYKKKIGETIHYLPKPTIKPTLPEEKTIEAYDRDKRIKKVKYISQIAFNAIINAKKDALYDENQFFDVNSIVDIDIQRNSINRLSMSTEGALFYTHETFFSEDVGLYFLLVAQDGIEKYIEAALHYLQERGFSGDISVGKGHLMFDSISDKEIIHPPQDADSFTTLSLYYPTENEFTYYQKNKERVWCNLIKRKGKLESSFVSSDDIWKNAIQMFSEGSTFPLLPDVNIYGMNPIVKEHPFAVQHYGLAFPIKMKIGV